MIGLALSGGGSRAIAFHLGCLRGLNDLGLLEKIGVVSTVSGGSLLGAYYAYTPQMTFEEFELGIRDTLRRGLQWPILWELAKPENLLPCIANFLLAQIHDWGDIGRQELSWFQRYPSRSDMLQIVLERVLFPGLIMNSPRRQNMHVVVGACELRSGSAFRFSNTISGSWRLGAVVQDIDVSFAVAASAAYPIFLPSFDRTWRFRKKEQEMEHRVLLTDGGVYDNLGIQVLEPGREPEVSLHTFPCDYLIVCNAGHGQESGKAIPLGFLGRVTKSFSTIHRRVQDSAMHHLHHLRETGSIKGFAMPYLGQQDERLPWKLGEFVSRDQVVAYPTNFAAMSEEWIEKLSTRGEQLTKILVSYYLPDLL